MHAHIVEHSLAEIGQGAADPYLAAGLDWWRATGGVMSTQHRLFDQILPRMLVCVPASEDSPPPFLYVGPLSPAASIFGTDWARDVTGQSGVPDRAFEEAVNSVYWRVFQSGEPEYHYITATIRPPGKAAIVVPYRRLVVPCPLRDGRMALGCFTSFIEPFGGRGVVNLHVPSTPANHPH